MVRCPECDYQFRLLLDEDDAEESGPWVECPECGNGFDPTTE